MAWSLFEALLDVGNVVSLIEIRAVRVVSAVLLLIAGCAVLYQGDHRTFGLVLLFCGALWAVIEFWHYFAHKRDP